MTKAITPRLIHIWKRDVYETENQIGIGDVLFVEPWTFGPNEYFNRIHKYNPITKRLTQLTVPTPGYMQSQSSDIAHTRDKLWIRYYRPEEGYYNCFKEYDFDFETGSLTESRDIGVARTDAGLSAISNTILLSVVKQDDNETINVYEVNITNHPAVYTLKFSIEKYYFICGDHLRTTNNKLITLTALYIWDKTRYCISQYDYATGRLEVEIAFSEEKQFSPYGIYQSGSYIYICGPRFDFAYRSYIYSINTFYPYQINLVDDIPIRINGSSQIPEYITNIFNLPNTPLINFGELYNHYAACDPRMICRDDWMVPSKSDYETLITYLGGSSVAGGKMKETGTLSWHIPNYNATNSSGFSAKAANYRLDDGTFADEHGEEGMSALFWTTTIENGNPLYLQLAFDTEEAILQESVYPGDGGDDPRNNAASIRLVRKTTNLTNGQTSVYCGFNGRIYRTICIGTQEWLAENLAETEFLKGYKNYGVQLYNWYAVSDARNIAAADWHVPSQTEFEELVTFLGGSSLASPKVKSINNDLWASYYERTNESKLTLHGSGQRLFRPPQPTIFIYIRDMCLLWTSTSYSGSYAKYVQVHSTTIFTTYNLHKICGLAVIIVKDFTLLSEGEEGTYTGNNGKTYGTICINGKEWLKTGLDETLFRNLDPIPERKTIAEWDVSDGNPKRCYYEASDSGNLVLHNVKDYITKVTANAEWNALVSAARCSYKNNDSYILN